MIHIPDNVPEPANTEQAAKKNLLFAWIANLERMARSTSPKIRGSADKTLGELEKLLDDRNFLNNLDSANLELTAIPGESGGYVTLGRYQNKRFGNLPKNVPNNTLVKRADLTVNYKGSVLTISAIVVPFTLREDKSTRIGLLGEISGDYFSNKDLTDYKDDHANRSHPRSFDQGGDGRRITKRSGS